MMGRLVGCVLRGGKALSAALLAPQGRTRGAVSRMNQPASSIWPEW